MNIPSYILESHDSTSGKRVIRNRTGNCPTRGANVKHPGIFWWCQKWPYKMIWLVMDRRGGGRVLAVTPSIWLFFPTLSFPHRDSLYVMRILPLHSATHRPLWAGFFWALWVRPSLASSDSFQLLTMATELGWGKLSKQQPNKTWGHLQHNKVTSQLMSQSKDPTYLCILCLENLK